MVRTTMLDTRIGSIELDKGMPATDDDMRCLFDASDFQRACQAYLWSLPLVSLAQWQHSARSVLDMRDIDMVVYESLGDRLGILTANASMTYIVGLPDLTRTGPLIIDYPSGSSAGVILDFWQRPVHEMGEFGPDKGVGGRYLVVAPGQKAPPNVSDFVVQSPTTNVFIGFRALDADPARANALIERFSMGSHDQPPSAEPTTFLRPHGRAWTQVPPRGLAYWNRLSDIVQREVVQERDQMMYAMLAPLGIEKGRRFAPNARQRRLLEDGAQVGEMIARANAFGGRSTSARYHPDARWREVVPFDSANDVPGHNLLDERAEYFYKAVAASTGRTERTAAKGQACLSVFRDSLDHALDGARTYRVRVPANPPARLFWSLTIYDADQRVLVNNGRNIAERSSRSSLRYNSDGSVDLYVGPSAPTEWESNWIPTTPGAAWFAYFRLYEPLEAFFAHRFALPDFELMNGNHH